MSAVPSADAAPPVPVEQIAHLSLQVGRMLLENGADTAQVEDGVTRMAAALGGEANLLIFYEGLLATIAAGGAFRTKVGHRVPAVGVGLAAVTAVNRLLDRVETGATGPDQAGAELDAIEHAPPVYKRWMVVLALGLTAASLSRLFGGDWPTFAIVWVAGAAGTWLRQELGRRRFNAIAIACAAACLSGVIGGAGVRLIGTTTPALCLVAPGMIIVPGVPLINGLQDMIRGHVGLGVSRLAAGALITTAIALGLFVATLLTGVAIPVDEPGLYVPLAEDAVFSALAAFGFVTLFSVPAGIAWASVACGLASHTTRTLCTHLGLDIVSGTFIGALLAGILAHGFARRFAAPAVAFAFPGVVAMVPGAYAFRAFIGSLHVVAEGAAAPVALVTGTLALTMTSALMVAAIAIGVAAPLVVSIRHKHPR